MNAIYKSISKEGFSIIDFVFLANINLFAVAAIWCWYAGNHPIKDLPWNAKGYFVCRLVVASARFTITAMACAFAPISLVMIIETFSPFLISALAFVFLGEAIIPLEIMAMVIVCVSVIFMGLETFKMDEAKGETIET